MAEDAFWSPIGQSLALSGFGGCQVKRLNITMVLRHEIWKRYYDHDQRSHGNGEREEEPAYAGPPWMFRASDLEKDQKNPI
jgi:hypothetical protein